jgi:hypothetical protein
MPFDGSGNYNRVMDWTNDAAANIKIRADRHDQNDDDIAAALSLTMTRDGQSQPTADLPMNGKKLTNLGAPVNPTDAATKGYADGLKASPVFTGKVTLPTGVAATPPVNWPNATANPTTPANGDMWPDSAGGGLKHRIGGVTYTYGRLEAAQTWTGAQTFANGNTAFGAAGGTGQTNIGNSAIELGQGRTADGASYVDFHAQNPDVDYSARILRNSGANGTLDILNNGSGGIGLTAPITNINGGTALNPTAMGIIGQSGSATGSAAIIQSPNNAGAAAFISFNRLGVFAANFGIDTDNFLKVGGWSMGGAAYKIMHEGLVSGTFSGTYNFTGALQVNGVALPITKRYESAQQTITGGGALTLAHGLGTLPKLVTASIICTTAELGYSVGDELVMNPGVSVMGGALGRGFSIVPDATNINVRIGSDGVFNILAKSNGGASTTTAGRWTLVVRAWA